VGDCVIGEGSDGADADPEVATAAVAAEAAAEAAEEEQNEEDSDTMPPGAPLWQGGGELGYLRNVAMLLRPEGGEGGHRSRAGRLLLRSCSHSVDELQRLAGEAGGGLIFLGDLTEEGKDWK
jgi:hypothetical protein